MDLLLDYGLSVFIGTVLLFIMGKVFSADPPNSLECFLGAFIIELFVFLNLILEPISFLLVLLIVSLVVINKICHFKGVHAFFAAVLYILITKSSTIIELMINLTTTLEKLFS